MITDTPSDGSDAEARLAQVESQLRRMKAIAALLALIIVAVLFPTFREMVGVGVVVACIAFAVLLFISLTIATLNWATRSSNHESK